MSKLLLGDVAIERKETCKEDKNGFPIVGLEHLTPEEVTLSNWDEDKVNTFTKIFYKGDVLFGRRRAYLKKAAVAPFDGICSGDITVIKAIPERILPELLPFIIQNDSFFQYAVGKSAGSLSPRVKWEHLRNYEFKLPSISKQRELAKIFWVMEETKKSYQKLLQLSNELIKSRFIELFGIPGTDSHGWGLTSLGECCVINPRKPKDMNTDVDYSFVAMTSVSGDGRIDATVIRPYSEIYKGFTYFAENDVLFAKITPCMENGKGGVATGLHNGSGFGSTEFHVLRPIEYTSNPYWLYAITMFQKFRSDAEKVMTGTGGQRRVPTTYLSEYQIALPPIEMQEQFAAFIRQSDKSKFELEQTLVELTGTYKKLMSENFG